MKKISLLSLVFVSALGLTACGESSDSAEQAAEAAPAVEQAAPAAEPVKATAATSAPAAKASSGEIGIAECDDYVAKYRSCLDKMPSEVRDSMQQGLDAALAGYKQSAEAAPDQTREACKMADAAAGQSMKALGCDW